MIALTSVKIKHLHFECLNARGDTGVMGSTRATGATGPPGGEVDDNDNDTDCEGPVGE